MGTDGTIGADSLRSCAGPGGSAGLTAPFAGRWMGPLTSSGRSKRDSDVASDPAMDSRMNPRRHDGECRVVDEHAARWRGRTLPNRSRMWPNTREGSATARAHAGRLGREVQRDEAGGRPEIRLRDGAELPRRSPAAAVVPGSRRGTPVPRRSAAEPRRKARHSSRRPIACDCPASGPAGTEPGRRRARPRRNAGRRAKSTSPVGAGPCRTPRARKRPADCLDASAWRDRRTRTGGRRRRAECLDRRGSASQFGSKRTRAGACPGHSDSRRPFDGS